MRTEERGRTVAVARVQAMVTPNYRLLAPGLSVATWCPMSFCVTVCKCHLHLSGTPVMGGWEEEWTSIVDGWRGGHPSDMEGC